MLRQLLPALRMMLLLTVVTGLVYPALITGACQLLFPARANGSLVKQNGRVVGSALLGQNFSKPEYFHPRPSAAGTDGYDPTASGGSNFGPTSQKLYDRVKSAANQFYKDNAGYQGAIPADALTASASGLDPDISPAYAAAQIGRVAQARHISAVQVSSLVSGGTQARELGMLGEPRVNVLQLNLALDKNYPKP